MTKVPEARKLIRLISYLVKLCRLNEREVQIFQKETHGRQSRSEIPA